MCCRFINCVLSVQTLVVPVNTFFFFFQIPKFIVHPPFILNRFPIHPVPSPFLPRSSSFTSSVCSFFCLFTFQFCLFFFPRFEPFSLSFRFGVRAYVWDYLIPLLYDQLSTLEIHLPMSALCQDIELPFSGV